MSNNKRKSFIAKLEEKKRYTVAMICTDWKTLVKDTDPYVTNESNVAIKSLITKKVEKACPSNRNDALLTKIPFTCGQLRDIFDQNRLKDVVSDSDPIMPVIKALQKKCPRTKSNYSSGTL